MSNLPEDVVTFVQALLDDWASAETTLCGEFCVGQHEWDMVTEEISDRRSEWERFLA